MLVATIPPPPGNVIEIGPLTIHYYGIAIAIGVLASITLIRRRFAAFGGDPDLADRVALWAVGAGFVGARLGYVLPRLDRFADNPLGILAVWEGGLVFFGGLFAGAATAIWLIHRSRADLPSFADAVAPGIPLAQAFGRWGNYFNQELFGTSTDLPWALEIEQGGAVVDTVHPTFLYEMLGNLALMTALILIGRTGRVKRGSLMFLYAMGYGVLRFLLELIRTDERAFQFLLSANGWVSVGIFAAGLAGFLWWQKRPVPAPAAETGVADAEDADADAEVAGDAGTEDAEVDAELAEEERP
jgi:prolipoprotein diacylglyceryl transferase